MRIFIVGLLFCLFAPALRAQVDRAELGYQTTSRGIVWYRNGPPTHAPVWRLSRDTTKVMWRDTFTALRYDWSYKNDVWETKGVSTSTLPPLPTFTSGSATIDNRTAFWRPASNLLHYYDFTATAWVPFDGLIVQSAAPTNIASGGGNGAAVYTTSLWQDGDDQVVYCWDGAAWTPFPTGGTDTDEQTFGVTGSPNPTISVGGGTGGGGSVQISGGAAISVTQAAGIITITNTGDLSTTNEIQRLDTFAIVSNVLRASLLNDGVPFSSVSLAAYLDNTDAQGLTAGGAGPTSYTLDLSGSATSVTLAEGANINLTRSANTITIEASTGGAATAANNGLTLSGSTVQLGGTLIQATTIDQNSFLMRWHDGQTSFQRSQTNNPTNLATVDIDGEAEAITKATTPIEDAILNIHGYNTGTFAQIDNQLSVGVYPSGGGIWIQGRGIADYSTTRYLAIQPNGGQVSFGNDAGSASQYTMYASLAVPDGTLSKSTLHLRNANTTNGANLITFGVGGGTVYDGGVGYFLQSDATRLYNANTTGTPSVRIAVGSETGDEVTVIEDGTGFGTATTSDILSTVQIEGSHALQTNSPSGDLTLTSAHSVICKVAGSSCTYTLPTASGVTDRVYWIMNHTVNTITLSSSVTKANGSTFNTVAAGEIAVLFSVNGNGWRGAKWMSL